jgi:glycosyltransferase involved in cell wall biosynthesis
MPRSQPIYAEPPHARGKDPRPGLAIIAPELTPYRIHFHRRIVREIPELRLWSLVVRDSARSFWKYRAGADIGAVYFAEGEAQLRSGRFTNTRLEWTKARRVRRWLQETRPAAIFTAGYMDLSNIVALRWARRNRIPALMWADSNIRGDTATGHKRRAKNAILRWIVRQPAAILPCGTLGREYFIRYGARPDRIFLCPYEPDYDQISSLPQETIDRVAQRFDFANDRKRMLYCGRLVPAKRPDLAIDAFSAIAHERPEWDLVLAGIGPMEASLRQRIPADLTHRITFTGFVSDQAEVTALNRLSQILLHPAQVEPWGLVINEAAAAGLAFVTTNVVGAAAELVRDQINGRICPPNDLSCLVQALRQVTEPQTLARMQYASAQILAEWRQAADPVRGVRAALIATGALSPSSATAPPATSTA